MGNIYDSIVDQIGVKKSHNCLKISDKELVEKKHSHKHKHNKHKHSPGQKHIHSHGHGHGHKKHNEEHHKKKININIDLDISPLETNNMSIKESLSSSCEGNNDKEKLGEINIINEEQNESAISSCNP